MQKTIFTLLAVTLLITGAFATNLLNKKTPKDIIVQSLLNAPIKGSFNILNVNYEKAVEKLEAHNIRIIESKNINELALAHEIKPLKIIEILKG